MTYRRLGRALELLHSLAPRLYHRILPPAFEAGNYGRSAQSPGPGQILDARPGHNEVSGGWKNSRRRDLARAFVATASGGLRGLFGRY